MDLTSLVFIDATGYNYEDYPSFLLYFTTLYQGIYGADIYLGADSQDGQIVAAQAQAAYDTAALGAVNYSSFSPATAQGTGLSRVVKINGIERDDPSNSTVDLTITGVSGTTSLGWIAADDLNQQWVIPDDTEIPDSGTVTVTATAAKEGAIVALPNTITQIFTPTQGWQTVNNAGAATPGAPVETDSALRQRQAVSVANPSQTVFEGTLGRVGNVSGVTAFQGYENDTDTEDGNTLPPHSIAIVAQGGTDTAVAQAIQIGKTPGTNTYGTTNIPLTDSRGMPITINFFRPTNAEIGVQVTITTLTGWSSDYIVLIQNAVAAAILTTPIGGSIIITKLYVIAYLVGTAAYGTYNIESIELEKNSGGFGATDILLVFDEIATCDPATDVTVLS